MYYIITLAFISLAISVGAFAFSNTLTEKGMILNRLDEFLESRLPEYLYKPLIGCQYCVAGQWALWGFIILSITGDVHYRLDVHILFTLCTIFTERPLTYFYHVLWNDEKPNERIEYMNAPTPKELQ